LKSSDISSLSLNNFINAFAFKQSEHLADHIGVNASSKQDMINVLKTIEELENGSEQKTSALYLLLAEHPKTSDRINYIQNIK
jgi:Zn-dependent protease with chaperone function